MSDRELKLDRSRDEDETLYTVTISPTNEPVLGLIVAGDTMKVITWPDGEQAVTLGEVTLPEPDEARLDAAMARALDAIPRDVELVYLNQGDELMDKQIQHAFTGAPPYEDTAFDEFESEARYHGLQGILEYYVDDEDLALIRGDQDRFDNLEITVQERDTSDPFMALARKTPHKWMRYVANWDTEPWPYENAEDDITGIAEQLGIDRDVHADLLRELVTEANGGGVYVLWYGEVENLIVAAQTNDFDGNQVPQTITWENPHLLVLDCMGGGGHMVDFPGTITLPFDRVRLMLDARNVGNGYSWSQDVAGLAGDRGTTTVTITGQVDTEPPVINRHYWLDPDRQKAWQYLGKIQGLHVFESLDETLAFGEVPAITAVESAGD